jgi:hypothetical protein
MGGPVIGRAAGSGSPASHTLELVSDGPSIGRELVGRFPAPDDPSGPWRGPLNSDPTRAWLALAETQVDHGGGTCTDLRGFSSENSASADVVICTDEFILTIDKTTAFAEMFRTLTPGGWAGITDIVADDTLTPAQSAMGCDRIRSAMHSGRPGPLSPQSHTEYREVLMRAGFIDVQIMPAYPVSDGMHLATVTAVKPIPAGTAPQRICVVPRRRPPTLAVWEGDVPTSDTAAAAEYTRLCTGFLDGHADVPPTRRIRAFIAELDQHMAEVGDHDIGAGSWAGSPVTDAARGPIARFTPRRLWAAPALCATVLGAQVYGLAVFDVTNNQLL